MVTLKQQTNAQRFIGAYNAIDHTLRMLYNFKANISFTDLIRRCASLNDIIRSYEDDLIALARLRNAIIHNKSDEIIAEPHEDMVQLTERIARILSTPPLAIDAVGKREVATVQNCLSLRDLMIEVNIKGYSNLPVYKGNALIGVINLRKLVSVMGKVVTDQERSLDLFVNHTTVEEFLREFPESRHYQLSSAKITIEEVLRAFNGNRKLGSIIITRTGNFLEKPIGIITEADVMDLMKVLEDF